jgi:prephenate dehydrogenase
VTVHTEPYALRRLAIIGCGLIGGSFGLAMRKAFPDIAVVGYGRSNSNLMAAQQCGAITHIATSLPDAVTGADVVLLSVPVGAVFDTLSAIAPHLKPEALLMDAGSTKQDMVTAAAAVFSDAAPNAFSLANVVPAHPIAGKEKAGVTNAEATLYNDRLVILTPTPQTTRNATAAAEAVWQATGARVIQMDAHRHDRVFGAVSHLPHLLAFAYMNGVDPTAIPMGGTGFQDFSRIAASDPVVWRDILQTNRTVVLDQINAFEAALADLKNSLIQGDAETLTRLITQASVRRKAWKLSSGRVPSNEDDAA